MEYNFTNNEAVLKLFENEISISKNYFSKKEGQKYYNLLWNKGADNNIKVDGIAYVFKQNTILPIMLDQSYTIPNAIDILCWQFNAEFYCIANHDAEVGCIGFLFYGLQPVIFIDIDTENTIELERLKTVFIEEFESNESIKGEMLRMMIVSLIIKTTRLAKKQYTTENTEDEKFKLFRQYNFLVELHYKEEKSIQFYASQLNKSVKTLSNIFSLYSNKTPLQIIHQRLVTEAKRLFYYTDKSVKEIAYELGFEDAANFSKFFKNQTSKNPTELKAEFKNRKEEFTDIREV